MARYPRFRSSPPNTVYTEMINRNVIFLLSPRFTGEHEHEHEHEHDDHNHHEHHRVMSSAQIDEAAQSSEEDEEGLHSPDGVHATAAGGGGKGSTGSTKKAKSMLSWLTKNIKGAQKLWTTVNLIPGKKRTHFGK